MSIGSPNMGIKQRRITAIRKMWDFISTARRCVQMQILARMAISSVIDRDIPSIENYYD